MNPRSSPLSRVVLLGRQGFVARALQTELETRGQPYLALGRSELDLCAQGAAADLAARLQPGDRLIFLAALTPEHGRDGATLRSNLAMAETVAKALAETECRHLTYVSSDAVYGWQKTLIDELTPPSPTDLYGLMHLTRETVVRESAERLNLPCAVLRPSAIYGPGDTHSGYGPNRFVASWRERGQIELFGQGEENRDHVAITDIVALLLHLCDRSYHGVINGVTGRSVSFREVAEQVRQSLGGDGEILERPRRQPVSHRFFDATQLHRVYPKHVPLPFARGVRSFCVTTTVS